MPDQPACGDHEPHLAHNGMVRLCLRHDVTSNGTETCTCDENQRPWCEGVTTA